MLLKPDICVESVQDIQLDWLQARALKAIMIDVDDTMVKTGSLHISNAVRQWIARIKEAGLNVLVLSNGYPKRVDFCKKELGIDGFALVGKPFWFAFQRGLRHLNSTAVNTAMVGDQLFVDMMGANALGMTSILVEPLSEGLCHTRVIRRIERKFFNA